MKEPKVKLEGAEAKSVKKGFSLDDIASLLEVLRENDVSEFELERGGEKIALKRGVIKEASDEHFSRVTQVITPVQGGPVQSGVVQSGAPQVLPFPSAPDGGGQEALPEEAQAPEVSAPPAKNLREIRSPMVGTFYKRPAVDADAYVEVGSVIKEGQVLCIVEAMKIMNEIEAEMSGRVVEVCLDDAQMVEYGEVLFRVEPL